MSRNFTRILSIILAVAIAVPTFFVVSKTANADDVSVVSSTDEAMRIVSQSSECACGSSTEHGDWTRKTDCNGECGYTPIIIVPGIMQSQVYVTDKQGNDILTVDEFPLVEGMDMTFMFDTTAVKEDLKSKIWPMLKALLLGRRDELKQILSEILDNCAGDHYFNPDGTRVNGVSVDEYWYSIEEAKNHPDKSYNYAKGYSKDENGNALPTTKYKSEFDFILKQVNISEYAGAAGYDHAYFYAYSSFGDTYEIASHLNEYIDMVKTETGHDKVSIVFISLGGTIGNVYLSEFCDKTEIDRLVFAAAAVDGSYLLSDLMSANFSFEDNELLYNELVPSLISLAADDYLWAGYLANIIIRIIPQRLFTDFATDIVSYLLKNNLNKLISNCPSMWALVPSGVYEKLSSELISDDAHAVLKAKTDRYYNIQKNAANKVKEMTAAGMDIFVVCGYNLDMPSVFNSYYYSSDNIIQANSASIGATFAPHGEKLPAGYVPAIDSTYISPEGDVDAGTAALPERTWFIRNQSHLKLQSSINDVVSMCVQIAVNKNIKDAKTNNGGYKQYNYYRDLTELEQLMSRYNSLTAEEINAAGSAEQASELKAAYDNALSVYNSLEWDSDVSEAAERRLYTALYDMGLLMKQDKAKSPREKYDVVNGLTEASRAISNTFTMIFGSRDFWPFF